MSKGPVLWRSITSILFHPDNGQGNGGCKVGSKFAKLSCGHVKRLPKSRRIDAGSRMRCRECEGQR